MGCSRSLLADAAVRSSSGVPSDSFAIADAASEKELFEEKVKNALVVSENAISTVLFQDLDGRKSKRKIEHSWRS